MTQALPTRRGLLGLGLGAGFVLAGCATSVKRTTWPDITFQHRNPIALSVADVVFDIDMSTDAVTPPERDIRYAMPVSPEETLLRWSRERLQSLGGSGIARVTMVENRFVEVPLDTTAGVEGVFTFDQSERYEGVLGMRVDVEGDPAGAGFAQARASASRTVQEDFTLNQREETLYDMLHSVVNALDQRLEEEIRNNLARWVAIG
ncbi:MAG: hypothetical protein P8Q36_11015 [Alphaproteobacteria bacterium]|nr:hypothetical protein [Rhodospirillaceae bacterium]MBT6202231.1 hypothetical protein [Rhodospirillaceae bacterium]MBT6512211.1 hypothetical protein [Rhodospirillaceae bacterium]MBT7647544.1 hypothetical protein [Rhodospirillaceae bacterium]MDG2481380.1 hypothetical protein [Alphaproteobacteria bacterium]